MLKTLLAACVGCTIATVAVAQAVQPIAERQGLMKAQGRATRDANAMAKGEAPFDLAKAQSVFDTYLVTTSKFASLFPADSKTGETKAGPKIWEDQAAFRAAIAKFEADAKAAKASTTDLATFRTAFGQVTQNCNSCHETFRLK
ncbi:cytochrome c [Alsobacter sp. SYSU M60028]|uniref:Cytochrome c n=1 Tax=Alsobacter ponti TaxID=2962936 RepID=A0ABT1L795_9HYPH|nr:cytochrome c [Alsobacter ponti]MCP8937282.1 cytochrome c [Alsobacter ponti]